MESSNNVITRQNLLLSMYTKWGFILFLFAEMFFPYTIINQFAMLFMCGMVSLLCLSQKKMYLHSYFFFTLLLIVQSYFFSYNGISIDPQTSLKMTSTITINFVVALAVYNYILLNDNLNKTLFLFANIGLLFTVFITVLSLDTLFIGRLGTNISFIIFGNEVIYNANTISIIAGFSFLIYLYRFIFNKSIITIFLLIWLIIIILLTGSRKGLFLLILGTPLLIFLLNPKKRIRNVLFGGLCIIVLYVLIMNITILYNIIGYRMEALVNIVLGEQVEEASVNTRKIFVERGWDYFLLKPWTGYGLDNFRNLPGSYGTYSHNNYIELLISGGVFSFIFYYAIRIFVLVKLFINRSNNKINQLLFVILLLLLLIEYGLVDYYIRIYIILFVFALCGYHL